MITINITPFILTPKQETSEHWKLKRQLATIDLEVKKEIIEAIIKKYDLKFNEDIILTLYVNKLSMNLKIDFSEVNSKANIRLLKEYLFY
jgi:hypothetical protein